jgi:serine/threonine protein kinase
VNDDAHSQDSRRKRLQETILHLGIDQYDPVTGTLPQFWVQVGDTDGHKVDMTQVAGLTSDQFRKMYDETIMKGRTFNPTLQLADWPTVEDCPADQSFPVLDDDPSVSPTDRHHVLDLLQQMMTLDPVKRPNYDQLLQHPFFRSNRAGTGKQLSSTS